MNRWDVERAVLASELSSQARLVELVLLTLSDARTCVIPAEFTPSLTKLVKITGLGLSTVKRVLNELEEGGWVVRKRPEVEKARADHERTQYRLTAPGMAQSGPSPAQSGPSPGPTAGRGLGPERATSHTAFQTSFQQQHASPEEIVSEATGASPEEAAAIVRRIGNERPEIRSMVRFLPRLAEAGELKRYLTDVRAAQIRSDDAADIKVRQGQPACRHGKFGGNQPHSITGVIRCSTCRKELALNGSRTP